MKKAIVTGGGFGGLSAAIVLASHGVRVTLYEQQEKLGGKLQQVKSAGFTFDRGPSTITMIEAFDSVFRHAGRHLSDYVSFYPIEPQTRNRFADGHQVDITGDLQAIEAQIALYSEKDAKNLKAFMKESARLYKISKQQFLNQLLAGKKLLSPRLGAAFARIRPFTTFDTLLRKYFSHPNTLMMFGRYATYVGSSPYQTPAVFAMMAALEQEEGVYGVKGGTYELIKAFEKLASELGVDIRTGVPVKSVVMKDGRAAGVETAEGFDAADSVVWNGDLLTFYEKGLLKGAMREEIPVKKVPEPSLSGFALLLGIKKQYAELIHHTVFFPEIYEKEFDDIFVKKKPPGDPAIYICNSSSSDPGQAPENASNLFVLVNAPALSRAWDWRTGTDVYRNRIIDRLEKRGLAGLSQAIVTEERMTPRDLSDRTMAYKGTIYGLSSNTFSQAFFKPKNRAKRPKNLWFAGGSTHPGGGTPIVTLSGRLVAEEILRTWT